MSLGYCPLDKAVPTAVTCLVTEAPWQWLHKGGLGFAPKSRIKCLEGLCVVIFLQPGLGLGFGMLVLAFWNQHLT